jgi:CDP-glycerol glycerophosphotransferase
LPNTTDEDIIRVKKLLGLEHMQKKIILYAPTWRDNQHTTGVGYTLDLGTDFDKLRMALQDEYIILFRAHYLVANKFDFAKYAGFIYDVSHIDDINDLYIISDLLITDYSSVFFDYANLKRPMIFYMYDLDLYQEILRGFYLDLEELPGPIVRSENELIAAIKNSTNVDEEVITRFNKKFNYLEDGQAAKRVVEEVFQ